VNQTVSLECKAKVLITTSLRRYATLQEKNIFFW